MYIHSLDIKKNPYFLFWKKSTPSTALCYSTQQKLESLRRFCTSKAMIILKYSESISSNPEWRKDVSISNFESSYGGFSFMNYIW